MGKKRTGDPPAKQVVRAGTGQISQKTTRPVAGGLRPQAFFLLAGPRHQKGQVVRQGEKCVQHQIRSFPRMKPPGEKKVLERASVKALGVGKGRMHDGSRQAKALPESSADLVADGEAPLLRDLR